MRQGVELVVAESTAGDFHARDVPEPPSTAIWWHRITRPALVLGSAQDADTVDRAACAAAGVEVVARRSGGGAVLLVPSDVTWIDVIVARDADGWGDDVSAPMVWLGRHLARAFAELGVDAAEVYEGAMRSTAWSKLICFDGVGAGEVLLGGRKLVGMSQRRTRNWARLQCCWYSRYDHADLVALLAPEARPPVAELAPVANVSAGVAARVPSALHAALVG